MTKGLFVRVFGEKFASLQVVGAKDRVQVAMEEDNLSSASFVSLDGPIYHVNSTSLLITNTSIGGTH